MKPVVFLRGGGDLASGVALRLFHSGLSVVIAELPQPLTVRRTVAFSEAVFDSKIVVEDVTGVRADSFADIDAILEHRNIAVIVDPEAKFLNDAKPLVVIDGRMLKKAPESYQGKTMLAIGLGPGFVAGEHCHAVIETMRGPFLGRVYWQGTAQADTGLPERVAGQQAERVLRSPATGVFHALAEIGDVVTQGQKLAQVGNEFVLAPFNGLIRGLLHDGVYIEKSVKVGDVDPRFDQRLYQVVSDKSLAIGGAVLEVILSTPSVRQALYG
ncbi:MAG TPA: selenium-dependent molybdenum cofactor biosynthesis protein YqeB [Longilinea sp.]|nr:selenium-dependent molybdenum cofactor biosynthesis protein YqeB [Longilinea sp.]